MGSSGGTSIRRAGVFVRTGDLAFLPHLLFGTPIKSHSFRTFPARSRLSARPGPTMARRTEASPFTRLGTLTIGRVAAQASHRHSPQVTRSRIKPRPPGEKGGRPRGRARPRRGAMQRPRARLKARWWPRKEPPKAEPGSELSVFLGDPRSGTESQLDPGRSPAPSQSIWIKCSGGWGITKSWTSEDPEPPSSLLGPQH